MREKTEIIADVKAVFSEIRGYADQMRGFPVDPLTAVLSQKPELKARFEALILEALVAGKRAQTYGRRHDRATAN